MICVSFIKFIYFLFVLFCIFLVPPPRSSASLGSTVPKEDDRARAKQTKTGDTVLHCNQTVFRRGFLLFLSSFLFGSRVLFWFIITRNGSCVCLSVCLWICVCVCAQGVDLLHTRFLSRCTALLQTHRCTVDARVAAHHLLLLRNTPLKKKPFSSSLCIFFFLFLFLSA